MVHMIRWRDAAMALVLSLILVLGATQLTEAKTSRMQQTQSPQADCSANAGTPQLGKGQQVSAAGSINCSSAASNLRTTARLEMKVGNSWISLNESSSSGPAAAKNLSASASEACTPQQTNAYRGVISGSYSDESGSYKTIPDTVSSEVSLMCA